MAARRREELSFDGLEVVVGGPSADGRGPGSKRKKSASRPPLSAEERAKRKKYSRGDGPALKGVKDKKLRRKMRQNEAAIREAEEKARREEILQTGRGGGMEAEGEMERTWRVGQDEVARAVDERTRKNIFDLRLDTLGPYRACYSRNGQHLLLAGRLGHAAVLEWRKKKLVTELQLRETLRDACFLHSEQMWAAAQKKYVYIYDHSGTELHCLRSHVEPTRLDFLPYHWLLVSVGKAGYLKYQDTSTGSLVAEHRTRLGQCDVLAQNPHNSVSLLGHRGGHVTMWSPNMSTPLVKMLCHRAPVQAVTADRGGRHMVTAGLDGQVKVWDLRTYRELHSYYSVRPATTLRVSDTGMLALACGPHVQVWRDALARKASAPYMVHTLPGGRAARSVAFCPFEDVLGVAHTEGFSSIVVPGAGEANFDAFEANPFEGRKAKREGTVHRLLEKVQPEMITLDPNFVGTVDRASRRVLDEERDDREAKKAAEKLASKKDKKRAKGRNSSLKRWLRKRKNIIDHRKVAKKEELAAAARAKQRKADEERRKKDGTARSALDRFAAK